MKVLLSAWCRLNITKIFPTWLILSYINVADMGERPFNRAETFWPTWAVLASPHDLENQWHISLVITDPWGNFTFLYLQHKTSENGLSQWPEGKTHCFFNFVIKLRNNISVCISKGEIILPQRYKTTIKHALIILRLLFFQTTGFIMLQMIFTCKSCVGIYPNSLKQGLWISGWRPGHFISLLNIVGNYPLCFCYAA